MRWKISAGVNGGPGARTPISASGNFDNTRISHQSVSDKFDRFPKLVIVILAAAIQDLLTFADQAFQTVDCHITEYHNRWSQH